MKNNKQGKSRRSKAYRKARGGKRVKKISPLLPALLEHTSKNRRNQLHRRFSDGIDLPSASKLQAYRLKFSPNGTLYVIRSLDKERPYILAYSYYTGYHFEHLRCKNPKELQERIDIFPHTPHKRNPEDL